MASVLFPLLATVFSTRGTASLFNFLMNPPIPLTLPNNYWGGMFARHVPGALLFY